MAFLRVKTDSQAHENSDPTPSAETTTTPPIPDSIVYAPERSDAPISLNMDEILKELDWENEQTEPSCTNWMANLPSLTG